MSKKKKDSLKYGEARRKLEEILKKIEGDEVDVDDLADQVKEAAHLIQVCRKKLQNTRQEVEKVVSQMDLEEEGSTDQEGLQEEVSEEGAEGEGPPDEAPF